MDQDIVIKKIVTDDVPVIVSLADRIWPATYREILSPDQIAYMMELSYHPASLRSQMTEKGHQFIIALHDEKAVAFASYSSTTEAGVYRLHKIYVDPAMQGHGIGRRMIDYIFAELISMKANTLELNVNRHNKAKLFYEKLGFIVVREEDIDIGGGYLMNDYVMRKIVN
jgi:diamine N-acetyltransferase